MTEKETRRGRRKDPSGITETHEGKKRISMGKSSNNKITNNKVDSKHGRDLARVQKGRRINDTKKRSLNSVMANQKSKARVCKGN